MRRLRTIDSYPIHSRLFQRLQPLERKSTWSGLARLPAMDREWRHCHSLGELDLGQIHARAGIAHPFGEGWKLADCCSWSQLYGAI